MIPEIPHSVIFFIWQEKLFNWHLMSFELLWWCRSWRRRRRRSRWRSGPSKVKVRNVYFLKISLFQIHLVNISIIWRYKPGRKVDKNTKWRENSCSAWYSEGSSLPFTALWFSGIGKAAPPAGSQLRLQQLLGLLHVAQHWDQSREHGECAVWGPWRQRASATVPLTEFEVTGFVGVHPVGVAAVDVGPHGHRGVWKERDVSVHQQQAVRMQRSVEAFTSQVPLNASGKENLIERVLNWVSLL